MIKFVFFGTPELSAEILEYLKSQGLTPSLVVTNPDRPQGRKMIITPPPVKVWALREKIPVLQPEDLKEPAFLSALEEAKASLFVVVAYGKIIPKEILKIPSKGSLNIHYSLLPKYRGASPIETAILNDDKEVGVSILLLDEKMDHGPIVAEKTVPIETWPPSSSELRAICNDVAGKLLAESIPLWIDGKIQAKEQEHLKATYAKKIKKEDGLIDLVSDGYQNFLKIQAYKIWPQTFFFTNIRNKKTRVIISDAAFVDGKLVIKKVIPEGKKEVDYSIFKSSI